VSDVERTQNRIYLKENRYDNPNETYKVFARMVKESGAIRQGSNVCDIGCAAGEFLYFLRKEFPGAHYWGCDVFGELVQKARAVVPDVQFEVGSILDRDLLPANSVDVAFALGVISIFDEFETSLSNLLHWTKKNGCIYVLGLFNPYPIDVWVKYRLAEDPDPTHREPGWNIFSKASISRYLDKRLGSGRYSFTPFEMPFDLQPNPEEPWRTWTFRDARNRRLFTNGLCLLVNQEILELRP